VIDLEKMELNGELIFFPLGGSTLALWSSRLEKLNRPEFHLCDRDTVPPIEPRHQKYIDEVNSRDRCKACSTLKKEIENYLHKDAIVAAYKELNINLNITSNFDSFDDVPCEIARLVHESSESTKSWEELTEEQRQKKESKAKRILCMRAAQYMTKEMLDEIDADGDLINWFENLRSLVGE